MDVVAVVGLGCVGLPLAVAFGKIKPTIEHDLSSAKLDNYRRNVDPSATVSERDMRATTQLCFTSDASAPAKAGYIIVAVPTPIAAARKPDFGPLIHASESVGAQLRPGGTVIYGSTVYPGATEEVCIPVLERASGLRWQRDFHAGYSPERIHPGDPQHNLANTVEVVGDDSRATLDRLAPLCGKVRTGRCVMDVKARVDTAARRASRL